MSTRFPTRRILHHILSKPRPREFPCTCLRHSLGMRLQHHLPSHSRHCTYTMTALLESCVSFLDTADSFRPLFLSCACQWNTACKRQAIQSILVRRTLCSRHHHRYLQPMSCLRDSPDRPLKFLLLVVSNTCLRHITSSPVLVLQSRCICPPRIGRTWMRTFDQPWSNIFLLHSCCTSRHRPAP